MHQLTPLQPCARPTWGLNLTLICGTTSSAPGYEAVWGQCGHLGPIRARSRSILLLFNVRPSGRVAPLLVFMGGRPVPQPKWGYGVAQQYICRLQPLRNIV
jgi:hypothetical protein